MSRVLMLYGPRDIRFEAHTLPALGPNDVRVRTRLGAISAGTEAAWYFGTDPQLDPGFRPGKVGAARFPRMLGYEKMGEVIKIGSEVSSLDLGQRVVGHYGHAEEIVLPEERLIPVPDDITDEQAVVYSLATVATHGIRRSRMQIGDDLFVTGLGFIGLLTVKIGRLAGARRIVATDPFDKRRALALGLGADEAFEPSEIKAAGMLNDSDGFDVAIETAGSHDALCDAMSVLRRNGRVCVVSQLKGSASKHPALGIEFHLGELEMISSDGRGDVRKLTRWYFDAVRRGDLNGTTEAITHSVPFLEIKSGFELLEREPENVVKIVVTYD